MNLDREAFRRRLEERAAENRRAFEGLYREELEALLGLSREEIRQITPDTTSMSVYDELITVVKEASAANVAQADLRDRIVALGDVAVQIARRIPAFAALV